MRGQNDLRWIKKGPIGSKIKEKIDTKCLKLLNNTFWWQIRPTLGPCISRTKCDRDKPIFSAQRVGQSDRDEAYNRDPFRSKIWKTEVIIAEPLYDAQMWEYPPQGCAHPSLWGTPSMQITHSASHSGTNLLLNLYLLPRVSADWAMWLPKW